MSERDDLQLWLRHGRLGHPYQSEVERARRMEAEDAELRERSRACVCSAHQQPRCAHFRMGKCSDKAIMEGK